MVESTESKGRQVIIAKPNHSSSWRNNLWALIVIAVPSLGAAIGFTLLGAWPVLPFAGAELLGLGSALYYVNWKLQYRHVITLSADQVRIDKGHYAPKKSWTVSREDALLSVTPEKHPWDGPSLSVQSKLDRVTVGEFLNRDDSLKLLKLLRRELRIGTYSGTTDVQL